MLDDRTVISEVKGVDLVLDATLLGWILNLHVEGFDTYVQCEWPCLGEKDDVIYVTSLYTQKREQHTARKLVHKLLFEFVNKCVD